MVRLYSLPALLSAILFHAKRGNWDSVRYYAGIIPYRFKDHLLHPKWIPLHLSFWVRDIVDFYRRNKKWTWNPY